MPNGHAQQAQVLLKNKQEVASLHSKGRARFIFIGVTILGQFIISLAVTYSTAKVTQIPASPAIGGLFVWVVARGGNNLARLLLGALLLANVVVLAFAIIRFLELPHELGGAIILTPFVLMSLIALGFLSTRSVNVYLDDQRHPGQD